MPERDVTTLWTAIRGAPGGPARPARLAARADQPRAARLVALDHLASPDLRRPQCSRSRSRLEAGPTQSLQGIIATLVDPLPAVRRGGCGRTRRPQESRGHSALAQALSDPEPEVREEALRTLSDIDDERVLDPLINALRDPEAGVRGVASEALIGGAHRRWPAARRGAHVSGASEGPLASSWHAMGSSAVDPLVNLLRGGHPDIAATVGDTLERLVGRECSWSGSGSMDPAERLGASKHSAPWAASRPSRAWSARLSDPNEEIRIRTLQRLGDIGTRAPPRPSRARSTVTRFPKWSPRPRTPWPASRRPNPPPAPFARAHPAQDLGPRGGTNRCFFGPFGRWQEPGHSLRFES